MNARLVVLVAGAALFACQSSNVPTPPDILARYHALTDTLSFDTPGESVALLESFLSDNRRYQIADSAAQKIVVYRGATHGLYHLARELARDGEFDRAEQMLQDLALVDTEDGKSARTHLQYEFYIEKAKWLLVRQRFEEARGVGEWLITQDLNRFQRDEAEKILDYTGHIDAAMSMVESQNVVNACKQLIVLFASNYADNGYYPSSFSLADLEKFDAYTARSIARNINRVESYTATQDHYTLVALGRDGRRYTIEDGELK
ncbi:MAG TPA: hypothetical protein VF247_00195 [Candidatus Krumholzibacteria bacterium]